MARRKRIALPQAVTRWDEPCKNGQPYVAADGSCLRCGADQGVHGYACGRPEAGTVRGVELARVA